MAIPKRIRVEGETFILESVSPNMTGMKRVYKDNVYVIESEEAPEMFVFEGVAFKRTVSVAEYMRKIVMESAGKDKTLPKRIRLKGTNKIFEMREEGKATNWIYVRVTYGDGSSYTTQINGDTSSLESFKRSLLGQEIVTAEDDITGVETKKTVVNVEQI